MFDDEKQFLFRLDERVDAIGERIAALEGRLDKKEAKGFKQHLSEYGGIMALVLSILIGAFTVYDKVVVQPQIDMAAKLDTFRENLDALVQLSARISSLDWSKNSTSAQAQAQSLTPQKIALIEKIERFGELYPEELKFADRLMLANENELFMWHEKALAHAMKALEISIDASQAANAYWAIARLNGKLDKLSDMRAYYEKAVNKFEVVGLSSNAAAVMQLYIQWIYMELIKNKTCSSAKKVFDVMKVVYSQTEVWPITKEQSKNKFKKMLSQSPKTCDLELL